MHAGPAGAGHFVKMVHNGIEYGLMQAYAEGFDILRGKAGDELPEDERFDLNLADIAEVWRRGSVVSSWLLDLTAIALAKSPELTEFTGEVDDSGEGRWTIDAAIEEAVAGAGDHGGALSPASAPASSTASAKSCCRRCATNSAAMSKASPAHKAKDDDK